MTTLKLNKLEPIESIDHDRRIMLYIPEHQVLGNIPLIWRILEQIIQDWSVSSKNYPTIPKFKYPRRRDVLEREAFEQFKPRIFICLFSYVIFFFMLENGYQFVYSELNRLNKDLKLHIHHDKPPKWTDFINSLWKLRNFTIAHWAGTERMNISDSIAGRGWGGGFGHTKPFEDWPADMEHIVPTFTGVALASIPETHARCSRYLTQFDQVCADYLKSIITQMPKTVNGIEYHGYRWTRSGLVKS